MSEASDLKSSAAPIDGVYFRIVPASDGARAVAGVTTAEGRFHHHGQPALYMSPSHEWAERAIDRYRAPGDMPRVAVPLRVTGGAIVDLRCAAACAALRIAPADLVAEWWRDRASGRAATSWRASDAVRAAGLDGMIYPSRTDAVRWHLVMFGWNEAGKPVVAPAGVPIAAADAAGRMSRRPAP